MVSQKIMLGKNAMPNAGEIFKVEIDDKALKGA
jgi:hypothetical protein